MQTDKTKILILDAHSDAALACVQSLGRAGDYEIHLGAGRRDVIGFASRYPVERYVYPDPQRDRDAFLRWLRALDAVEPFDYILPITDATLLPVHDVRDGLRAQPILPPAEALDWAFSKDKTVELAARVGVPVPRGHRVRTLEELPTELDYPVYLKPVSSKIWSGNRGRSLSPSLARSPEALDVELRQMLRYGPVLVQEYFQGVGVGVEVLCDRGEIVMAFAHRRVHEYPLTGGRSTYRVSIPVPPDLLDASRRLLGELGWHGVAMVEFKQSSDDYRLMEINGRFWGSLPLAVSAGADFPRALLELYRHGRRPAPAPARPGLYARNFMADTGWMLGNLRAPRDNPLLLIRPRLRSLLEPARLLAGREVWDHFARDDRGPGYWQLRRLCADGVQALLDGVTQRRLLRSARTQSLTRLKGPRPRRVLVVCDENLQRSAFAERHLAKLLRGDAGVEVRSAGLGATPGRRCSEACIKLGARYGVDLRSHRAQALTHGLIRWADLILVMDRADLKALARFGHGATAKAAWFGVLPKTARRNGLEIGRPSGDGAAELQPLLERLQHGSEAWARWLDEDASPVSVRAA